MLKNTIICLVKNIKDILICVYFTPLTIAKYIFKILSVKKKIVFNNFNGRGFGDNPQYIAEEILRQGLNYDLVWMVKDMNAEMPEGIRKVKIKTIKSSYELSTAKVIISNVKNALPFLKKEEQFYIQTWHAELAIKLVEGECEHLLDPKYVRESKEDSAITDLILSGCRVDTEIFKNYFWYHGEILEKGIPRYDMLFNTTANQIENIKRKLGTNCNTKILLYAPTFRDDGKDDAYNLDIYLLKNTLERITGEKWEIIIRMHPNARQFVNKYKYDDTVLNGSIISNPQELVLISDLLITDYSSIMVDFMILRKPVILYVPDLIEYEKSRGLRPIYHDLPFIKVTTNSDLVFALENLDLQQYCSTVSDFVEQRVQSFDDGHASEHVVERIKKVMK